MATKKGKKIKNKKLNKNNIARMLIPIIAIGLIIYIVYKVIKLVIVATDMFMIEKGTIYNEESAVRLCYKR